jgi:ribosomal protein S18 acetylase RimI-like enzyme
VTYRLRSVTDDDYAVLYALHREAIGPHVEAAWGPWDEAVQPTFFQAILDRGLVRVVEIDGEIAGLLEVDDRFDPVYITNIELAARFQGRGIGTAILRDVLAQARDRNATVGLQVLKVNPAQRLYRRLGFTLTGETPTHFQMAWSDSNAGTAGTA